MHINGLRKGRWERRIVTMTKVDNKQNGNLIDELFAGETRVWM